MAKLIQNKNKQFSVNLPKDVVESIGWKKGDNIIISKMPEKNIIFIERVKKK